MEDLKIEYLPIDDLTPYDRNARKHDVEDVQAIMNSIQSFGFSDPIGIWGENNTIVEGHGRLEAAKRLEMEKVPVIRLDHMSNEQRKAYALAHNKTAELSSWLDEVLQEEIDSITDFDMGDFGFEPEEIEVNPEEIEEDDFDIEEELPEEPKAQLGDIYRLGNHRLICGDSTDSETIAALMDGEEADLLVTDPPYNVAYEGKTKDALTIQNDSMDDASFRQFLIDAFKAADNAMKPGAAFYIWHADSEGFNFRMACREVGWPVKQCLIWNKNTMVLGRQDYQWKHEPCLYGWKEGAAHFFVDDRRNTTVIDDAKQLDIKKMKKEEMQKLLEDIFSDKVSTTVLNEAKPSASRIHPTMKPLKLIARNIKNSSKTGWKVLDIFGGSGSTLMACEQLGRHCYTCELDPKYIDAIIERWENFTGCKAELLHREGEDE